MTTTSTSPRSSSSSRLGPAEVTWTGRAEGDLRAAIPPSWAWARQVHGAGVLVAERVAGVQGEEGDALVTTVPGVTLAVFTADCAPIALAADNGVVGVAHAGWRGLSAGVIEATIRTMREAGADRLRAALGPCIRPCCYEFGADDLQLVAARLDDSVRSTTTGGGLALDMPRAVRVVLDRCDVELAIDHGACTSCGPDWFSHRARQDSGRQATTIVVPA